jgi:hypothetical protein
MEHLWDEGYYGYYSIDGFPLRPACERRSARASNAMARRDQLLRILVGDEVADD